MQEDEKTAQMRTSLRVSPACGSEEALDKTLGEAPVNHAWPWQNPPKGDLPNPGIKATSLIFLTSPALAGRFFFFYH